MIKKLLAKENIKFIQSKPRFGFGYDKNIKDIFTYDSGKIIQNIVGFKTWVKKQYNLSLWL